jgi:hypothetical protein
MLGSFAAGLATIIFEANCALVVLKRNSILMTIALRFEENGDEVVIIATRHTVESALEETGPRSCQSDHPLHLAVGLRTLFENWGSRTDHRSYGMLQHTMKKKKVTIRKVRVDALTS